MSSEVNIEVFVPVPPGPHEGLEAVEPMIRPAEAPAATLPSPAPAPAPPPPVQAPIDPACDHEDAALVARRADVDEKHRRLAAWLEESGYDAAVLGRSDSIAWFTSGAELGRTLSAERAGVLLFVNGQSRAVLCDNVRSARIFEEELCGLGFQLKERPWFEDPSLVVAELGRNKKLAGDGALREVADEGARLRALRGPLTTVERRRLREVGRMLALALEATAREFRPGATEAEVAGDLAHRLIRQGAHPVDLRVAGDDRLARHRRPTSTQAPIRRQATLGATARRHGLCVSATRTVAFGEVDRRLRQGHNVAAMVDATCIYFSRPGESVADVFRRARRIYEKYGFPDEWTLDEQGDLTGYLPSEVRLTPDLPLTLRDGDALRWSPSVGPARSEDTVVVDRRGYEVVTEAQAWPKLVVSVKDLEIARPDILRR